MWRPSGSLLRFPQLRKIIEGAQCGICIDPCNARLAASAIMDLLEQPELRQEMGRYGRNAVLSAYNWPAASKVMFQVYKNVLSSNRSSGRNLAAMEQRGGLKVEMPAANRSRKIIVNADDFGMSAESNRAIVEAFAKGAISSATLMTDIPGFDEACELAHGHGLTGKIGVHLNLTSGYPLSLPIRRCPLFCNDGGMFRSRQTRFRLSKEERLAVETELRAQVEACLDRGLRPTHLHSHHHVHTEWAIGSVVIAIARRYRINAIRLSRNCGTGIDFVRAFYKFAYNTRLRIYGLAKTRYFGSSADVRKIRAAAPGDVEVMVHLTSEDPTRIPDSSQALGVERWFATHRLASYS